MNKLEYELVTDYLEQLSYRAENTIRELQLLQKHIHGFKTQLTKRDISDLTRANIPVQPIITEITPTREKQPSDLIRIKEVMAMTGVSRTFIHQHRKEGDFPEPVYLSSRSIAWTRLSVEQWIMDKINNN